MKSRIGRLKSIFDEGRVAFGSCLDSYSPAVVETAGYSGLDFVRLDTEYSWRRDDSLEHLLRAAAVVDITTVVRVEKGNPFLISKALQAGAGAILVSEIASLQEAEAVVKAARFPPRGNRGYSTFSFSGRWGAGGGKEWIDWTNTRILVGVMVETRAIVEQADDLFAIDGLDFGFFGPSDYGLSIGLAAPKRSDPAVQDAIRRVGEAANKHDKIAGIPLVPPWKAEARTYRDMGYRMLEIGHDLGVLHSAYQAALDEVRKGSG